MKYKLERGADTINVVRHGRIVTLEHGDGRTEDRGAFDDRAAETQLQALVASLLNDGWVESEAMRRERAARQEQEARHATLNAMTAAWAAAADPVEAFRELTGRWVPEPLVSLVERLEAGEDGVTVYLSNGAVVVWARSIDEPLTMLWAYRDAESFDDNDHCVHFAYDTPGPPVWPDEVQDDAEWFLETFVPNEKYWFSRDGVVGAWEHDGGRTEDGRTREAVFADVLSSALRRRGG